jgi:hypothetical protein
MLGKEVGRIAQPVVRIGNWKSQGREDGWVISNNPTRLCIESWSPLRFYSAVRGG